MASQLLDLLPFDGRPIGFAVKNHVLFVRMAGKRFLGVVLQISSLIPRHTRLVFFFSRVGDSGHGFVVEAWRLVGLELLQLADVDAAEDHLLLSGRGNRSCLSESVVIQFLEILVARLAAKSWFALQEHVLGLVAEYDGVAGTGDKF